MFSADKLWNYEVGAKGALADGRVRLNGSYFHLVWDDMQTARRLNCGFGFRENVGGATSDGVELEIIYQPIDGLTLTAGGAYIDSKLSTDVVNLKAKKGDKAPFVPETTFNASAEYNFALTGTLDAFVYGNFQHIGERATEFSPQHPSYRKMEAYNLVNLRAGLIHGNVEYSIYANNALDDRGVIRAMPASPFDPEAKIRVTPRTIGANVRMTF